MLLLVLIFVLAAFGLLLVALVTSTAAWAWISVAVSVAAAGALVYDWAQRRAAARSGGGGDRALSGPAPVPTGIPEPPTTAIPVMGGAMTDPATEVFPAVRPNSPGRPPVADAPETVAFRPVAPPSGSPDRPSSAEPDGGRSADRWSPRVTPAAKGGPEKPDSAVSTPTSERDGGKPGAERSSESSEQTGRTPPLKDNAQQWKPRQPAGAEKPGEKPAGKPAEKPADQPAGKPSERAGAGGSDADRTTAIPVTGVAAAAAGAGGQASAGQTGTAGKTSTPDKTASRPEGDADNARTTAISVPAQKPAADEAIGERPERDAEDGGVTTAAATSSAAAPPADPVEERSDPAEAAIVAELDDEVLVIDEHPRYHVTGCRELDGTESIPLPAKEAVEYGFTPCGMCTPVHTLATRSRAASSS